MEHVNHTSKVSAQVAKRTKKLLGARSAPVAKRINTLHAQAVKLTQTKMTARSSITLYPRFLGLFSSLIVRLV